MRQKTRSGKFSLLISPSRHSLSRVANLVGEDEFHRGGRSATNQFGHFTAARVDLWHPVKVKIDNQKLISIYKQLPILLPGPTETPITRALGLYCYTMKVNRVFVCSKSQRKIIVAFKLS
jgi:hypothetical protein